MTPLYATISADGGLFTLTYAPEFRPDGTGSVASRQGYDASVFKEASGSGVPVVDFRTMQRWDGYTFPAIMEGSLIQPPNPWAPKTRLAEWVEDVRRRGATVEEL